MLRPSAESCVQIAEFAKKLNHPPNNKFNPDTYHITLRYWEDRNYLIYDIAEALETHKKEIFHSFLLKPVSYEIFGEEKSLVMRFSSNILDNIHTEMENMVVSLGMQPDKFLVYKPHMSLAESVEKIPSELPNFNIKIDKVQFSSKKNIIWDYTFNH